MKKTKDSEVTRSKLLAAARDVIRSKGYTATTVDDICAAAQLSKGSFFHHFASKEQLGAAAAEQFGADASAFFAAAPHSAMLDPRERLLGYVDFRASMLQGETATFTCLLGTMVQEVYATHPQVRAACDKALSDHVAELRQDIEAAKQRYAPDATWSADSVAQFMVAVVQGSFILVKAQQGTGAAVASLLHLKNYLGTLLGSNDNHNRSHH